jgi:hypothetical protein
MLAIKPINFTKTVWKARTDTKNTVKVLRKTVKLAKPPFKNEVLI